MAFARPPGSFTRWLCPSSCWVLALALWLVPVATRAQDVPEVTSLGAGSMAGSTGRISVNQVAGVGNQQANAAMVTDVPGALSVAQGAAGDLATNATVGRATVGSNAFAGATGILQLNQTTGAGNLSANAAFVGVGDKGEAVNSIALSQIRTGVPPPAPNVPLYEGQVSLARSAFKGASGLVQVDQTAGLNNTSANTMSVHMQMGAVH
jgi:hypothetical protein